MAKIGNNPTVSVIIPTYNRAHSLGKAIQSVLDQTYRDFELIVVDDGSTDNTDEVVRGFKDERIRYIRLEKNSGTSAVPRNTGIKVARGEYIAFQDDDSVWLPEKLEKQIKAFEGAPAEVGVVYTGLWEITDNRKTYKPYSYVAEKEGNIHQQLLRVCFLGNLPVLVKKECFERVGLYDEELPAVLDWDMWLRVSKYYRFKLIDEPLLTTYYSRATTHYGETADAKGVIRVCNKHFQDFMETDKKLLAERYFRYGLILCQSKDTIQFTEGRRCLWKASRLSPLRPDYGLDSLISLLGPAVFHNRPSILLSQVFKRLRPLIERLRPFLGFAYPLLNKVSYPFIKIMLRW